MVVWTQRSVAAGFPHIGAYAETYIGNIIATVVDTHYGEFEKGNRPKGVVDKMLETKSTPKRYKKQKA